MLINSDETGRDYLMKTLQKLCVEMEFFEEDLPDDDVHNDVYKRISKEEILRQ